MHWLYIHVVWAVFWLDFIEICAIVVCCVYLVLAALLLLTFFLCTNIHSTCTASHRFDAAGYCLLYILTNLCYALVWLWVCSSHSPAVLLCRIFHFLCIFLLLLLLNGEYVGVVSCTQFLIIALERTRVLWEKMAMVAATASTAMLHIVWDMSCGTVRNMCNSHVIPLFFSLSLLATLVSLSLLFLLYFGYRTILSIYIHNKQFLMLLFGIHLRWYKMVT